MCKCILCLPACLPACTCCRDQEELQIVVSLHSGSGNQNPGPLQKHQARFQPAPLKKKNPCKFFLLVMNDIRPFLKGVPSWNLGLIPSFLSLLSLNVLFLRVECVWLFYSYFKNLSWTFKLKDNFLPFPSFCSFLEHLTVDTSLRAFTQKIVFKC